MGTPNTATDLWDYHFGNAIEEIAALERRYGTRVVHELRPGFLPESWLAPPSNGSAEPIDAFQLSRVAHLLPRVLARYPDAVLTENLETIRLCRRLELFGTEYGGASFGNAVYLTAQGRAAGFTDRYLELLFHHEFSSVLMRNYGFPEEHWLAANPPEVRYAGDVAEILRAIEQSRDMRGSEALHELGLLAEYALTALEDDVNLYAETAFAEPDRMAAIVARHPVARAKYEILREFYLRIDDGFAPVFAAIDGT